MATNGIVLIKPSSVAKTGASSTATINAGGSVTFSLCETLSLNDVFSSAYDNYIIDMRLQNDGANNALVRMRLRLSGTDNSTASSYTSQELGATSTTVSGSRASEDSGWFAVSSPTQRDGSNCFVYGPALAQPTAWRSVNIQGRDNARLNDYAATHNQSTAYDGFTIYPTGGSIVGLIKVFGLVK